MTNNAFVIGVDYGTDSVRSLIVDANNGNTIASAVFYYPRWKQGLFCDASKNQFRQHPLDYIEGLEYTITECIKQAGEEIVRNIKAISVDTTGSTTIAVDATGTPLCFLPEFENNPNAMFVLWKDHTAITEAARINEVAKDFPINYLQYVGGIYSSEWYWAKLLHVIKDDTTVKNKLVGWIEHCDWIPFLLTGGNNVTKMYRGVCSAGHKALWANEFDGYPPNDFFKKIDPLLDSFVDSLPKETFAADVSVGVISESWATKLGLPSTVKIGVGAFDCHMGAVGGQIEPYYLSKVMGTTTCDMLVAPKGDVEGILVKGICGQVHGSIIPNMIGFEAGQSAFGDAYAWVKNLLSWSLQFIKDEKERTAIEDNLIAELSIAASKIPLNENDEIAMDWVNGRRTPDANQELKGAYTNLNLGTDAPRFFKAMVEATCFGSRAILERFKKEGILVKGILALGGVAKKSPYVMQTMSNVLNSPIKVLKNEQTCALGAAMFAATVAGVYSKIENAMQAMGNGFEKTYEPEQNVISYYETRYKQYGDLGNFIENIK